MSDGHSKRALELASLVPELKRTFSMVRLLFAYR